MRLKRIKTKLPTPRRGWLGTAGGVTRHTAGPTILHLHGYSSVGHCAEGRGPGNRASLPQREGRARAGWSWSREKSRLKFIFIKLNIFRQFFSIFKSSKRPVKIRGKSRLKLKLEKAGWSWSWKRPVEVESWKKAGWSLEKMPVEAEVWKKPVGVEVGEKPVKLKLEKAGWSLRKKPVEVHFHKTEYFFGSLFSYFYSLKRPAEVEVEKGRLKLSKIKRFLLILW